MSKQAFEAKLQALEELRGSPGAAAGLRKGLADRNNYVVSKAAALAEELQLTEIVPDLLVAFDRHFAPKADGQCWAKNAIAKALVALEHHDAEPYLRGLTHVQMEPVWGGQVDTAATLRGTCALALIDCRLDDVTLLTHLADALADAEKTVRVDAAVALSRCGIPEAVALLRFKAKSGDAEPEVLGQCLHSLLQLAPRDYIPFVEAFLAGEEDVKAEAASALAQCPEPAAWEALVRLWGRALTPDFREALRAFLAASPHREAAKKLVEKSTIRP